MQKTPFDDELRHLTSFHVNGICDIDRWRGMSTIHDFHEDIFPGHLMFVFVCYLYMQ